MSNAPKVKISYLRILLLVALFPTSSFAQEITIGVPSSDSQVNIIKSEEPFAQILLNASTQTLVRIDHKKKSGVSLLLADSFSSSVDGGTVEFRLRLGAFFTNSELIGESDLRSSFNRCTAAPGVAYLDRFKELPEISLRSKDRRLFISVKSTVGQDAIFAFVAGCPIMEERSLKVFAEDLGFANLILASGPYIIASRIKNREARLERVFKGNAFAAAITVRGFTEARSALTALQTGTVDAFYTLDKEVLEGATKDPTLLIVECGVYNVVLRKGLEFGCEPQVDPGSIRYSEL